MWTGLGSLKASTGETVFFSGRDDNCQLEGAAIIFQNGLEKSLLDWKRIGSR